VPFIVLFATAHTIYFNRDQWTTAGLAAVVFGATLALLVGFVLFAAAVEWIGLGFKRLSPRHVSIYEPYYWYHERHWKWGRLLPSPLFDGTPLRPMIWRLLGVRIGRRVVDEGCLMPERSLTTIGDDSCLNERSTIQGHSLEDGVFNSDNATVGNACTLGVGAFVHYGTNIQDEAVLGPDSFLLKGETIGERSIWSGNPARVEKRLAPLRALHAPAQPPASPPTPAAPASAAG
jgi:non-ribosomal peptide synthetase-like protein